MVNPASHNVTGGKRRRGEAPTGKVLEVSARIQMLGAYLDVAAHADDKAFIFRGEFDIPSLLKCAPPHRALRKP